METSHSRPHVWEEVDFLHICLPFSPHAAAADGSQVALHQPAQMPTAPRMSSAQGFGVGCGVHNSSGFIPCFPACDPSCPLPLSPSLFSSSFLLYFLLPFILLFFLSYGGGGSHNGTRPDLCFLCALQGLVPRADIWTLLADRLLSELVLGCSCHGLLLNLKSS